MVQPFGPCEVEEGFIDRQGFDKRRDVAHQFADLSPHGAVFFHIRPDHRRIGAELEGLEHGHRRVHPLDPGDVTGRRDDTALSAAHDHRFVPQGGVIALLDAGIERIAVDMGDR